MNKFNDSIKDLTPEQLKERNNSKIEANFIHKEIVYIIKAILLASMFIILGVFFSYIF